MPVPRALLLALALLFATGLADVIRHEACASECRDDGCDGDCSPGSDLSSCACHCPTAPNLTTPSMAETLRPPATRATPVLFDRSERIHASPDPREILHVPKRAF